MIRTLALALIVTVAAPVSRGWSATKEWNNNVSGSYTDPIKWTVVGVPAATDTALFDRTFPNVAYTVSFPGRPILTPLTRTVQKVVVGTNQVTLADALDFDESPANFVVGAPGVNNVGIHVGTTAGQTAVLTTTLGSLTSYSMLVGAGAGATGTVNVNAGNLVLASGGPSIIVDIGLNGGTGTLNVNPGAVVSGVGWYNLGIDTDSRGTINVNGGTLRTSGEPNSSSMVVGHTASGALNVTGGGTVSLDVPTAMFDGNMSVGSGPGALGNVQVVGAGSAITDVHSMYLSGLGTANLFVADGGQVRSFSGSIGANPSGSATASVNGVNSKWSVTDDLVVGHDNSTFNSASLIVSAGGTVETGGVVNIARSGRVAGEGLIDGDVVNFGVVDPGQTAALSISGAYLQGTAGKLRLEIAGTTAGSTHDILHVGGAAVLNGGVQVALSGGFSPAVGDLFTILSATGGVAGAFSPAASILPALGLTKHWVTLTTSTSVQLLVAPGAFDADFDEDGDVDAADLTKWRTGFGVAAAATHMQGDANRDGAVDGADFLVWQRQLGSQATVAVAIPESSGLLLATICLAASRLFDSARTQRGRRAPLARLPVRGAGRGCIARSLEEGRLVGGG